MRRKKEETSEFIGKRVWLTKDGEAFTGTILALYLDPFTDQIYYFFEYDDGFRSYIHVDTPTEIAILKDPPKLSVARVVKLKKRRRKK